jgi:glycerophosphoryl diester phosphodiesterase
LVNLVERVPVLAFVGWLLMASRPLVFAHRGASRRAPENTLAAFRLARAGGADGVELDVRRTADGELVVHHDPDVSGFGLLVEHPFARLRAARPGVPTLVEALDACAGMIVNVEIKCLPWEPDADDEKRSVLHSVLDVLRARDDDVVVSSFELGAVDACRAAAPELATAWLTSGQEIGAAGALAREHGHALLHPDRAVALRTSAEEIDAVHRAGVRVNVWTVDAPEEVRALTRRGVDGIITNTPHEVRALF